MTLHFMVLCAVPTYLALAVSIFYRLFRSYSRCFFENVKYIGVVPTEKIPFKINETYMKPLYTMLLSHFSLNYTSLSSKIQRKMILLAFILK